MINPQVEHLALLEQLLVALAFDPFSGPNPELDAMLVSMITEVQSEFLFVVVLTIFSIVIGSICVAVICTELRARQRRTQQLLRERMAVNLAFNHEELESAVQLFGSPDSDSGGVVFTVSPDDSQ
jgi:hypothetical protein